MQDRLDAQFVRFAFLCMFSLFDVSSQLTKSPTPLALRPKDPLEVITLQKKGLANSCKANTSLVWLAELLQR